jgi:hypothetical protein
MPMDFQELDYQETALGAISLGDQILSPAGL